MKDRLLWMLLLWMLLVGMVLSGIVGAAAQGEACPGALPYRLTIGELGQVTPGGANNVRDLPTTSGARVGVIRAETIFTVLDGPTCADGFTWWRIATRDGSITGWTVESISTSYALQPYTESPWSPPPFPDGWRVVREAGAALAVNPALGWTARVERLAGVPIDQIGGEMAWIDQPDHLRVLLDDDGNPDNGSPGRVSIYPLRAYMRVNLTMGDNLYTLRDVLGSRPALDAAGLRRLDYAPFAALGLAGRGEYLPAPGLNAVRYVGHYTQDASSLPGGSLSYYFEGITPDGLFYVTGSFDLARPRLPGRDAAPADVRNAPDYLLAFGDWAEETLNALPDDQFNPSLATLDATVRSIGVDPAALADYAEAEAALPPVPLPAYPVNQPGCTRAPLQPGTGFLSPVSANDFIYPQVLPGGRNSGWSINGRVRPLAEPVCVGGAYWWLVVDERGFGGWVRETSPNTGAMQLRMVGGDAGIVGFAENTTQTPTGCALLVTGFSVVATEISFRPRRENTANPMRGDLPYYADALLARQDGGNRYYRLVPGAVNRDGVRWDAPLWVNASSVTPLEGCAGITVITSP
jgi:hypothetical protein